VDLVGNLLAADRKQVIEFCFEFFQPFGRKKDFFLRHLPPSPTNQPIKKD
jgi:hypothetical protein